MKTCVKQIYDDFFVRYPALTGLNQQIIDSFESLYTCYKNGGKVLACGNGGSASDAEHLVGELMKKFGTHRPVPSSFISKVNSLKIENAQHILDNLESAFPAISLISQTALITAIANDTAADMIYGQQVFAYGKPGDILIVFSTSGKSPNIINAVNVARAREMTVIGFTGESGGYLNDICSVLFRVPANMNYTVQEYHLPLYHLLCLMVEKEIFEKE